MQTQSSLEPEWAAYVMKVSGLTSVGLVHVERAATWWLERRIGPRNPRPSVFGAVVAIRILSMVTPDAETKRNLRFTCEEMIRTYLKIA